MRTISVPCLEFAVDPFDLPLFEYDNTLVKQLYVFCFNYFPSEEFIEEQLCNKLIELDEMTIYEFVVSSKRWSIFGSKRYSVQMTSELLMVLAKKDLIFARVRNDVFYYQTKSLYTLL